MYKYSYTKYEIAKYKNYRFEKHWKLSKKRDHYFTVVPICFWKLSRRYMALPSRVISSKVSL